MENLVREMKGNVRGGESFNYGAGSVRSRVTPQFSSIEDMQAARGKLVTEQQFKPLKDATNVELTELASEFQPYYKYGARGFEHQQDFSAMLAEPGGIRNLAEHYKDLPPELLDKTRAFLGRLRDMPTQYFEAKPQRAVRLDEFKGAVVPGSEMGAVAPILSRNNITDVQEYTAGNAEQRKQALMKFKDYFFGLGAASPLGALMAGQNNEQ
jgi:hypothetical protein